MSVDAVSRAYAILGLKRGCTAREVKQQYKALVRKWHPDRYANDPVGYAEATAELRRINEAFKTLEAAVRAASEPYPRAQAARAPTGDASSEPGTQTYYGRPLTAEEIDRLAKAIGRPDPVGFAMDLIALAVPSVLAMLYLMYPRGRAVRFDRSVGVFFVVAAIAVWFGRFRGRSPWIRR